MKKSSLLILLACLAPLGACADNDMLTEEGTPSPHFGDAQRQNLAAQVVNPGAPETKELTMDGQRAALAQSRYQKGKVIQPADTTVTTVGGSTGGGGGGGSQ